jgi:hypothetical protein
VNRRCGQGLAGAAAMDEMPTPNKTGRSAESGSMSAEAHRQAWYEDFVARAKGTNVNERTLLATDYLNHVNEIIMLLELVPDAPECLEDCRAWQPKTYVQHFEDSSIADRDLAIAAYPYSPPEFRRIFDRLVMEMNRLVERAVPAIEAANANADDPRCRHIVEMSVNGLRAMVDQASAAIHGDSQVMGQAAIDELMERSTASWA